MLATGRSLAASICPIFSLLLLLLDPTPERADVWFALAVAGAERLIRKEIDGNAHKALLDELAAEI